MDVFKSRCNLFLTWDLLLNLRNALLAVFALKACEAAAAVPDRGAEAAALDAPSISHADLYMGLAVWPGESRATGAGGRGEVGGHCALAAIEAVMGVVLCEGNTDRSTSESYITGRGARGSINRIIVFFNKGRKIRQANLVVRYCRALLHEDLARWAREAFGALALVPRAANAAVGAVAEAVGPASREAALRDGQFAELTSRATRAAAGSEPDLVAQLRNIRVPVSNQR